MAISEKITLLGKGLYDNIPDELTLKSIPTASELDYVGSEDFIATMVDKILPEAIEEKCNFRELLEIDFQWICRCLRILNYGPYFTTNAIYCPDCDQVSRGEYSVDLRNVEVKVLPPNFKNAITISKAEFVDFDQDIVLRLPTIQDVMNATKDKLFIDSNGESNVPLARLCYMIQSIGNSSTLTVLEKKAAIQNRLSSADFFVLKTRANELTDYGLRAGGKAMCPKCQSRDAAFVALVDDRFFRPTMGDLRAWKVDRNAQRASGPATSASPSGQRTDVLLSDAPATV